MLELNPDLEAYIRAHSDTEDPLLEELYRKTHTSVLNPHMLTGHILGKTLEMISRMLQPELILEIGTYTGYSAICLARGLTANGMLHSIDINDETESFARSFIERSVQSRQIILHTGDALEIIPEIQGTFDLVFIDGEKSEYPDYYNLVVDRTRPGGFILADNVLWDGKVTDKNTRPDRATRGILEFNTAVQSDPRVQNLILPVRDGLMIIRKL